MISGYSSVDNRGDGEDCIEEGLTIAVSILAALLFGSLFLKSLSLSFDHDGTGSAALCLTALCFFFLAQYAVYSIARMLIRKA